MDFTGFNDIETHIGSIAEDDLESSIAQNVEAAASSLCWDADFFEKYKVITTDVPNIPDGKDTLVRNWYSPGHFLVTQRVMSILRRTCYLLMLALQEITDDDGNKDGDERSSEVESDVSIIPSPIPKPRNKGKKAAEEVQTYKEKQELLKKYLKDVFGERSELKQMHKKNKRGATQRATVLIGWANFVGEVHATSLQDLQEAGIQVKKRSELKKKDVVAFLKCSESWFDAALAAYELHKQFSPLGDLASSSMQRVMRDGYDKKKESEPMVTGMKGWLAYLQTAARNKAKQLEKQQREAERTKPRETTSHEEGEGEGAVTDKRKGNSKNDVSKRARADSSRTADEHTQKKQKSTCPE